ncbi:hypothetical protein DF268_35380 [Streptomyces sp. V2]|uniref:hypothetical protein n=1 Tax=Streptomyces TaxID=1883 RepID=UPI0006EBA312|nr:MULTISPECIES: hypothetical protein [Streptomyces]PWG08844.1 hypothetical protein DF268_35380 [Streptomyces sp. V2]
MRPARFQAWLIDTFKNTPGVGRVQTLAEAGDSKHPFGVAVTRDGKEERWQITHQLAEGEKHEHAEAPVTDTPFSAPVPDAGAESDKWLVGVIGAADNPEIARVERWADRPEASSQAGVTVFFHNGSRGFVRPL